MYFILRDLISASEINPSSISIHNAGGDFEFNAVIACVKRTAFDEQITPGCRIASIVVGGLEIVTFQLVIPLFLRLRAVL